MVCGGLTEISSTPSSTHRARRRGHVQRMALAIAAAAPVFGAAVLPANAGTYSFTLPAASSATDWATPAAWTLASGTANAVGYPGGDPTIIDDASMIYTGIPAGGGAGSIGNETVTVSAPLANAVGNLTMTLTDSTTTDALNLQLNANVTFNGNIAMNAGAGTGSLRDGLVTLTSAANTTLTVGGTITLSGANGNGTPNTYGYALVTINGNASLGGVTVSADADTVVVSATAGLVNLGNVNLGRTLANGTASSHGGLHMLGGTITANNFLVGSNNSSAVAELNGANLTINGSFIVGNNNAASPRYSTFFQTLGNVNASNSTLELGYSTFQTWGIYNLSNGSLSVAGMQLTSAAGASTSKANFTMSSGTQLNVGAGGIGVGTGTYSFTSNGGTIAATASWTSPAAMALASGTTTFQAADGSGNPFNITLSGALTGGGSLVKTGGGALTLTGANTYTSGTSVTAGKLIVSNSASGSSGTGTGAVSISNATLAGTGIIAGDVTLSSGSTLAPGNNSVGTLSFGGNLTVSSGSTLNFDFNASANSLVNLSNSSKTLSLGTEGLNLYNEGTTNPFETNGTYDLFAVAGTVPSISGLSVLNGVAGVTYILGTTAHDITLTISGGLGGMGWAVDASGSWNTSANWNGGIPSGSLAILGNVLTAPRTVTLDGAQSVTGLNLNSPFGYTVAPGSGGTLTLSNGTATATINDFAGPHVISAPVILNSNTAINTTNGTDTLTFSNVISGTGNVTVAGPGTVIVTNSANTYSGGTTNNGNLQVGSGAATGSLGSGGVVNSGVLSFNSTVPQTISNAISGTGNVTQNGTGTVTLSGNNTYTGTTNIYSGVLQYGTTTGLSSGNINVVTPGKLNLNGLAVTVNSISGNGTVDNLLTGSNATLTFGGATPSFNGTIQNTGGNLTVVATTSGNLTLGGNNTYTGGTNVTSGQLILTSNNAAGTGNITLTSTSANTILLANQLVVSTPIVINNGSVNFVDLSVAGSSATLAGPITTVGSTQYRLGTSAVTSTLYMTGASTVGNVITLITNGNIVFKGNGSLINSAQAVNVGRSSATATANLTIQDNAVVRGVGINLGGINGTSDDQYSNVTVTGNGTLDAGTGVFSLNNSDTSGNVSLLTNGNSTVRGSAFTMTGSKIGASGTFWEADSGSIVATANNTNFMPASSSLSFYLGGIVNFNDSGFNIGIAQPISDFGGGINKVGNGSLSLSGNNAYSGGTTVSAGTLYADNAVSPLGTGLVTVNTGATLGGKGLISQGITFNSGSHLAPGDGATTGKLTLGTGVTLGSGSTLDFNFQIDGSANSQLELQSGAITGGAGIDLYQAGTTNPFAVNGTYTLVAFDGGYANPGLSVLDPVAGASYVFGQSGNNLVLTISGGLTVSGWAVDSSGSWATAGDWSGGNIPNAVGATASLGTIITAARTVTLDGNETVGTLYFNNANAYTIAQGTGGNLILSNGANAASIQDLAGSHVISAPVTLNSNTTVSTTNTTDSVTISGAIGGGGGLTTSGPGSVVLSGANTFAGVFTASGPGNVTLSGANSFGGLTNAGTGTVIVSGANTYTGPTTLTSGKIQIAAGGTLGNSSAVTIASGATLDLNGQSVAIGSLSGAGTIDDVAGAGTSTLTTGSLNANVSFSGVIKNTTGSVILAKVGTGNLTLTGASTYAGGTVISGGGLYVNNTSGSGLGNGTVTLNGGTLGGSGSFTGAITAGTAAHSINPGATGAGSIGTLKTGALTTNSNTTLAFDLASPAGTNDLLAVTGNVTLNGGKLAITSQSTTGAGSLGYYKVLSYTGTLTGATSGITLPVVANNVLYTLDTVQDAGFIDIHRGFIGDANDDGKVDLSDLNIVLNNLGTTNSSWGKGNFDGSATIDLTDLNDVLNNLGTSIASGSSVIAATAAAPEPASLGILALGAAALIARRRKA